MLSTAHKAQTNTLPVWAQGLLWAAASRATAWSFFLEYFKVGFFKIGLPLHVCRDRHSQTSQVTKLLARRE
jgi:hypothetical protein